MCIYLARTHTGAVALLALRDTFWDKERHAVL